MLSIQNPKTIMGHRTDPDPPGRPSFHSAINFREPKNHNEALPQKLATNLIS